MWEGVLWDAPTRILTKSPKHIERAKGVAQQSTAEHSKAQQSTAKPSKAKPSQAKRSPSNCQAKPQPRTNAPNVMLEFCAAR